MKSCSTSLVIMEMQIKATIEYHYIPLIIAKINSTDNTKIDKDTDQWSSHTLRVGMKNGTDTMQNDLAVYYNVKYTLTLSFNPTTEYYQREMKLCSYRCITALLIIYPTWN